MVHSRRCSGVQLRDCRLKIHGSEGTRRVLDPDQACTLARGRRVQLQQGDLSPRVIRCGHVSASLRESKLGLQLVARLRPAINVSSWACVDPTGVASTRVVGIPATGAESVHVANRARIAPVWSASTLGGDPHQTDATKTSRSQLAVSASAVMSIRFARDNDNALALASMVAAVPAPPAVSQQ